MFGMWILDYNMYLNMYLLDKDGYISEVKKDVGEIKLQLKD